MFDLMAALRALFGPATPDEAPDPTWAQRKLKAQAVRQTAIIKAMDAQVDAQRTSKEILGHPRRRATDRP